MFINILAPRFVLNDSSPVVTVCASVKYRNIDPRTDPSTDQSTDQSTDPSTDQSTDPRTDPSTDLQLGLYSEFKSCDLNFTLLIVLCSYMCSLPHRRDKRSCWCFCEIAHYFRLTHNVNGHTIYTKLRHHW